MIWALSMILIGRYPKSESPFTERGHEVCNYVLVIKEIEGLVGGLFS